MDVSVPKLFFADIAKACPVYQRRSGDHHLGTFSYDDAVV